LWGGGGTNYDGDYSVKVATMEMTIIVETLFIEKEKSVAGK